MRGEAAGGPVVSDEHAGRPGDGTGQDTGTDIGADTGGPTVGGSRWWPGSHRSGSTAI